MVRAIHGAAIVVSAIAVLAIAGAGFASANEDAHRMAQRFAVEAEKSATPKPSGAAGAEAEARKAEAAKQRAEAKRREASAKAAEAERQGDPGRLAAGDDAERRRADEQDMLARARAEAEERRFEMIKAEEEAAAAEREAEAAQRRAEETARAEQAAAEAEARRLAEFEAVEQRQRAQAAAREQARLLAEVEERARVAEIERQRAEELRRAAEAAEQERLAEAARQRGIEEARQRDAIAEAARVAAEQRRESEAREREAESARLADEKRRDEEVRQLAEKLEQARNSRDRETPVAAAPAEGVGDAAMPSSLGATRDLDAPSSAQPANSRRVTLLLVMEPGDRGIRRHQKTGDPVICQQQRCFVGQGADRDAREVSRWGALGTGNTLGKRAGACSQALTCIYRNVDLGGDTGLVQPIDLRILRHDRREERRVKADETCAVHAGRLSCRQPVVAGDYRLWVLPESVAVAAGPDVLQSAVRAWLPDFKSAERR